MNNTNGTAADFIDPAWAAESNTARILAVVTVFHVLALISVGLRVYARVWVIRAAGWDDLMIILSAVSPHTVPVLGQRAGVLRVVLTLMGCVLFSRFVPSEAGLSSSSRRTMGSANTSRPSTRRLTT